MKKKFLSIIQPKLYCADIENTMTKMCMKRQ